MNSYIPVEEKESNVGQQFFVKYLPYWPFFLLLSIFSMATGLVYLRYATPIFESSATLLIKDESKGGSEDSYITESLNLIASKKTIENEMEVLKSRGLMEKVVIRLKLYAPVSQEGKFKPGDAYIFSPVRIEAKYPDSMKEFGKIIISYNYRKKTVLLNNKYNYPLDEFVNTPFGILKFTENQNASYSNYQPGNRPLYFSLIDPGIVAQGYLGGLKLTPNKLSAIVNISYRDPIPKRSVDIINNLIEIYDQASLNEKNLLANNTLTFVNDQLSKLSSDLDSIERKVQLYKSGKSAVDIGAQGKYFLENVSTNDKRLSEIDMQLSMLKEVEKNVLNKQAGELLTPASLGLNDPTLSNLLNQLQTTELEYEKLRKTVGGNNPTLVSLADQVRRLRPGIIENIQNQRQGLEASKQSLLSTNSGFNSLLSAVPLKEKQLLEISREQMTKNSQYQFLLQKKQEAEMSLASVVSNSRIVDRPIASKFPISPNRNLIYLVALMSAIGFGIVIILIRDSITTKIKFRSEIERMTTIPILGEIAYGKTKTPVVIQQGTRSLAAEEFRKLRISLPFLGIDQRHKKILFTSSISGEGKSFIAANLAVSISLIGKKVVLLDMDLNQPTLSDIFNVEYENGVTEYLQGECEPDEIINKLESYENLFFVSTGRLPENPSEILAKGEIEFLLEYLDKIFDMIIIDTSPAVLVTDAYLLSGLCDATLYIVRHNFTPRLLVKRIDTNNTVNPLKNPAIIFNGVKTRGIFKNNYGYGYNYVYGNKYGSKGNRKKGK